VEELHRSDPRQIGSYRLIGRLGRGGMGEVFLGQSPGGRLVAVKVIRPELADGPDFRSRFAREVAAARRVSGIFTAPVVDADPEAAQPWLVTAYVDGPSLAARVGDDGAMPQVDVIKLGLSLAEGLSAIHAAGIVHRDLKPSNVLLASDGPRIIDFGISRAAEATSLTQTGRVVGSPGFMSPEQADGREVRASSDVFSLGAVLAFAATGAEPYGSGAASALLYRVVHADPDLTDVPAGLRSVVQACLRKNPADRPTPAALLAMLSSLSDEQTLPPAGAGGITNPAEPYGVRDARPALTISAAAPQGDPAPSAPATAILYGLPGAGLTRHRRRWAWVLLCAVIALAAGGGVLLAFHGFGAGNAPQSEPPAAKSSTSGGSGSGASSPAQPSPRQVVETYFAAINAHDWRKVWRLGGKHFSASYPAMVAGFQDTSYDVITHISVDGDRVTVYVRAIETTGRAQDYMDTYMVNGSVIASGSSNLITQ
jgi:eukaryotic-like serine/threonine-protein kinase